MHQDLLTTINKRSLISVMNNSKWAKLANALMNLEKMEPFVRIKDIYEDEPSGFSLFDWTFSEYNPARLEWVDINPIQKVHRGRLISDLEVDVTELVLNAILSTKIPYSKEESYFRIWGYYEAGKVPDFL